MAYDVVAESRRLLAGAPPDNDIRLSRRRRFVPLAADLAGEVAATMFLRRGVSGAPQLWVHTFESTPAGWRLLGGGGGSASDACASRPRMADLGGPGVSSGHGGTARTTADRLPSGSYAWIGFAYLRLAQEVSSVQVGDRIVPVAAHGLAVVVWAQDPPRLTALDATSNSLGVISVGRRGGHPALYRDG